MEYPIWTYGGGELLNKVFNAIAMIFESNNTYLTPVGTMAMTLGGVYIGIKAIYKGDIALVGSKWMIPSMITFLLLFAPKSTVWINDEVVLSAPVKVDHIPIGISFFTSLSSSVAHHLSKLIEETMLPADMPGSTHTGILYGAKAAIKLREIQIQDPTLLQNVKEYTRQCYMKPYVIGNFGNHKSAAIKATDILGFLAAHPAKCFGIKPRAKDGSVGKFISCQDAAKLINDEMTAYSRDPSLINKFASSLGISTSNKAQMNKRILAMTNSTFKYLDQAQLDVHEWMKQAMVLNANRESYDDWREKVGNSRIFPELVKMQATRGMFQQAMGSIVGAEMAEAAIPASAQPVTLALVMMVFVVILPLALLPGGWTYIVTGIKLMIWVTSWPVFYTIIHAIAMIQLKNATGDWGEDGLSLIGQGGFTELVLLQYSAAQSLITKVPFISFAIIFVSPYAFSSIAGSIASTAGSASIGTNMADGNLSMGQRSYNNLTRDQHNEAPTLLMGGGIVDDGGMRVQSDGSGAQIITEHQDQMATNYRASDNTSGSISTSLLNSKSDLASISNREGEQTNIVTGENIDVARNIANGTTTASNLSLSDVSALKKGFSIDSATAKNNSVSDGKATGTNSHLDLKPPGAFSAVSIFGAGSSTTASNNHDVREEMTVQERQAFNSALDKVKTAAKTDSLTSTSSDDTRLNKSLSANINKQDQIASDKARTQQDIDTYNEQLAYVQTNSGTIDRNANNEVMTAVRQQHPELQSKEQAARWMKSHRTEADAIAQPIISNYNPFKSPETAAKVEQLQQNTPEVQNTHIATPDSLKEKHQKQAENLENSAVVKDDTGAEKPLKTVVTNAAKNSNLGYNGDVDQVLNNNLNTDELNTIMKLENEMNKGEGSISGDVVEGVEKGIKESESLTGKSTVLRVLEDIGNTGIAAVDSITGNDKKE